MDLTTKKIRELRALLDTKEISAVELTQHYLNRIENQGKAIDCFISVTAEHALAQAQAAQKRIDSGDAGPLTGIPLAIKDNLCTDGLATTCGSKMLEDFVPPYNATVVSKLEEAGAVLLGKTSMDEFAMGGSTQTCAFTDTRNPYDLSRIPGGSSGGSAAAVSARLAPATLGSDTGGSIRQPAAFCGVTGLKPTYGRVSRYGLVAFASSLDQIGPIAQDAHDCAILLGAIAGHDPHDGTSSGRGVPDFTAKIGQSMAGMKIALPTEFYGDAIDAEVRDTVLAAAKKYESMGAELIEVNMPVLKYAVMAYYLISAAEASSNLSRYDGIKFGYRSKDAQSYDELVRRSRTEGFGTEVKRRILLGNYALSSGYYDAYYRKALALKQEVISEYKHIFHQCDLILTPTAPTVAYHAGTNIDDPVKMYMADICTVTVNIAGLPAITTACGYDKDGMPIGMSLIGNRFAEPLIVQAADAFENGFETVLPKGI